MITKYRSNSKYAIPDGEGFNALPIAFKLVIASEGEAISPHRRLETRGLEIGE